MTNSNADVIQAEIQDGAPDETPAPRPVKILDEGMRLLLEKAKTRSAIAAALGVSRALIGKWGGTVPLNWVPKIEEVYGIPRWQLRPDHYQRPDVELMRYLPELDSSERKKLAEIVLGRARAA
jgi:hypothetical protein